MKKILICALGLLVLTSCNSNTTSNAKNEEYHEMTVVDP